MITNNQVLLALSLVSIPTVSVVGQSISVSGKACTYFAAAPTGTFARGYFGVTENYILRDLNLAETRPPSYDVFGRDSISLVAQGKWHNWDDIRYGSGPEGLDQVTTLYASYEPFGIAGLRDGRFKMLVGVFTDDTPFGLRSPSPLNLDFKSGTNVAPLLFQTFPIGASRSNIPVPKPATRLYLGFLDSFDWSNNSGTVTVTDQSLATYINVPMDQKNQAEAGHAIFSTQAPLLKIGNGTLLVDGSNAFDGTTTVSEGVVALANAYGLWKSHLFVSSGATLRVSERLTTSIASLSLANKGVVDVTSGALTISGGITGAELIHQLQKGRGDGSWNGISGITSSVASASGGSRTVGWIDNGDGSLTVGFAAFGDTNLDWQVDILDAAVLVSSRKFDMGTAATWSDGDFNYDGVVDIQDVADFMSTGLYDGASYNSSMIAVAAVPEPSTYAMALAGIACGGYTMFRRRRA